MKKISLPKKIKLSMIGIYISLIIPLTTTYLLPFLTRVILGEYKGCYKIISLRYSFYTIIIISIILIVSTYLICGKHSYEIFYYMIGIIVSFIGKVLPLKENTLISQVSSILHYTLIIGYVISILMLLLSLQFIKWDNNCIDDYDD